MLHIGAGLKTKAPGTAVEEIKASADDSNIYPVTLIHLYVTATRHLRSDHVLLISYVKPHKTVHEDTIRRWVTSVMSFSGIDTDAYNPIGTRAAVTSKAKPKQVPLGTIMGAAMWSQSSTFTRYYDKLIMIMAIPV